jgi:hypothetical protein
MAIDPAEHTADESVTPAGGAARWQELEVTR